MVDISRDPRWGRTQEGAGEDAYLGAAMARAYVRGYQGGDLSRPGSVAACVKHFAAYGAAEAGREYNTTDMSLSRLHQFYLPPYKAAVDAGAATVMSGFNALNGVPATANPYLLRDVLRTGWGFNGLIVSDYTAVMELRNHGVALDAATATRKAFLAGVDVDMMSHYYDTQLPGLIRSGQAPMPAVDEAVRRVLRLKLALGVFERPYAEGPEVTAAVPEHRPLVRKAAEESLVLLQNKPFKGAAPLLPLSARPHKIALIGPLADDAADTLGFGGKEPRIEGVVTVKDALEAREKQAGGSVLYAKGTEIDATSEDGFAAAMDAARQADLVVMALGETAEMSGEGGSRAFPGLPGNQQKLLELVASTGRPVVLLVFSGRPLLLDWAAEHVNAIVEAWFPGAEGGSAIANVLYGEGSQRQAAHELSARHRPGAALLQSVPYGAPPFQFRSRQSGHSLFLALHRCSQRGAVSIRPWADLHPVRLFGGHPLANRGSAFRGEPRRTQSHNRNGDCREHGEPRCNRDCRMLYPQSGRQPRTAGAKPPGLQARHLAAGGGEAGFFRPRFSGIVLL